MTFIFTKLVWETLQITPSLIINRTYSLIFLGMFVVILFEKELVRITMKDNFEEVKMIFNIFITFMVILLCIIVAINFLPYLLPIE